MPVDARALGQIADYGARARVSNRGRPREGWWSGWLWRCPCAFWARQDSVANTWGERSVVVS
ncbi:MAG: hypothetical protein ACRD0V_08055, partial [Acidimicrobiales bacterium]